MRDARNTEAAPTPVFTTDTNGNRIGGRPTPGPAPAAVIHANLVAQDNLAKAPRPVAQSQVGATPADTTNDDTKDLSLVTAANRLSQRAAKVNQAIDDASQ